MWRDDDFENPGKNTGIARRDWVGELVDHPDFEPEAKAERADGSAEELSDQGPS
jgi:hypothetical protein